MQAKNVTFQEMNQALETINKMYSDNIAFRRLDQVGNKIIFTLKVKDNKGAGSQENPSYAWNNMRGISNKGTPKRSNSASWFVHGYFFKELINLDSEAVIYSSGNGKTLTINVDGGNWQPILYGNKTYGFFEMSELADNEP